MLAEVAKMQETVTFAARFLLPPPPTLAPPPPLSLCQMVQVPSKDQFQASVRTGSMNNPHTRPGHPFRL